MSSFPRERYVGAVIHWELERADQMSGTFYRVCRETEGDVYPALPVLGLSGQPGGSPCLAGWPCWRNLTFTVCVTHVALQRRPCLLTLCCLYREFEETARALGERPSGLLISGSLTGKGCHGQCELSL